jgi:DNA invertase Pin-like site-specific DNA recombinase
MKTLAYLRVSTSAQELANQKYAILDYAQQQGIAIDEFVETQASTRQMIEKRGIIEAIDRLIVSELSRLVGVLVRSCRSLIP